jgi:hypothetical protein
MDYSKLSDDELKALAANDYSKLSDETLKQLAGGSEAKPPEENARTFLSKEQEMQRKLADYLGRGMDYLGGGVRTGLGYATGVGQEGDIDKAIAGQAPSSSELLKRHGLEDNIGTSTAGFALDTLSDPLTYGTLGLAPLLRKALGGGAKLAGGAAERLGKGIYKMGSVGRVDEAAKMAGQLPISPVLWEHGISGSNPEILKKSEQLVNDLLAKRKQIFDEAAAKGVPADLTEIDNAIAGLKEKWLAPGAANERNKASSEAISEAEKIAKEYFDPLKAKAETQVLSQGPAALGTTVAETVPAVPAGSLEQLSSNLTSFGRNELTPRVYDKTKPTSNELEQALKAVRHGGKKAAEATAEKIGKGADYEKIQSELSALASGKKQLINEAKKTGNSKLLGAVGGGLIGTAKGNHAALPTALGFYAGKLAGMTYPQTKTGMAIGKSGEALQRMMDEKSLWNKMLATPAMQRALINQLKEEEQSQ